MVEQVGDKLNEMSNGQFGNLANSLGEMVESTININRPWGELVENWSPRLTHKVKPPTR